MQRLYRNSPSLVLALALCGSLPNAAFAGPDDLLNQAIEENRPEQRQIDPAATIGRADALIAAGQLEDAIALLARLHAASPRDDVVHLKLLQVKQRAGLLSPSDTEVLILLEESQRANAAQISRQLKLNIIQAGQAIVGGNLSLADQLIAESEALLRQSTPAIEVDGYARKLAGLKQSIAAHRAATSVSNPREGNNHTPDHLFHQSPLLLTETSDESASDMVTTDDAQGDSHIARAETTGELIDVNAALNPMQQRLRYERDLYQATLSARANMLLTASEAALAPSADGVMTFPADWSEKSARRGKYRGGMIARTSEFVGADGQRYYTAIYDLGDLVHPVPNFFADYPGTQRRTRIEDDDRFYLQTRSQIFNGYADDLAAGLPLLHFFGGIDNNAVTTSYDPQETERIVRVIDHFLHNAQPMQPN